jgi:hypothetical protein
MMKKYVGSDIRFFEFYGEIDMVKRKTIVNSRQSYMDDYFSHCTY